MSDEVSLPPLPSDSATVEELRAALRFLILWAQAREPLADGTALDKFMTTRAAVEAGQLTFVPGTGYAAGGGGFVPGPGTSNPADPTPPTPISGLAVAAGVSSYLVSIDAPTYTQGGGNGLTIIYKANYSGSGPLPTFADAVEAGVIPGKSTLLLLVGEPGQNARFWAKAETRHPTLQASPTGGTNGVSATADLIENQHIGSLSVAKLIAGSIAVGEYIQSTGYTGSGSNEWRIEGNGVARFTGVIVSGTVYATGGEFGGVTINGALTMNSTGHIKGGQTAYNTGTGFFLGYDSTAYKFSIGSSTQSLTWDGTALTITGTLRVGSSPAVSGTTMTGSGAVFNQAGTFAIGNSTTNATFNGSTLTLNGAVVTEANLNWNTLSGSIGSGNLTVAVSNGDQAYGSRTVTASGGTSPYTYLWSMGPVDSNTLPTSDRMYLTGTITSDTIGVSGYGTDNILTATVYVTITDANGRSVQASFTTQATHGTPP